MTPRPPSKQKVSSDGVDVGLEVTGTILKTLEAAAKVCPVPGISEAARLALQITDMTKAVRANQEGFKRLAMDASQLVYVIIRANKDISREEDTDPNLLENLDHVLVVLDNIEDFASKGASRNWFIAFWRSSIDAGKITEHREKLQQCLNKFGFESEISIRVMVVRLVAQHEQMMHMLENRDSSSNVMKDGNRDKGERDAKEDETQAIWRANSSAITIGTGADFSRASGIAIGSDNVVNYGGC